MAFNCAVSVQDTRYQIPDTALCKQLIASADRVHGLGKQPPHSGKIFVDSNDKGYEVCSFTLA